MGYVLNNPLKYNDPSGEEFFTIAMIVGAIVGAYLGGAAANNWELAPWNWEANFSTLSGIFVGAAIGAISGELLAAGITGGLAFGVFSVKLGVGIAIPGLGILGIAKAGEKLQTEFTNEQGETYNQNIGTIPTFGGGSSGGNSNDPPDKSQDAAVDADDVVPAHLRGGEIRAYVPTMADRWAENNVVQQGLYDIANAFSIVGQSMNPFDNQITTLRGEDISSHDRSSYGAEVAASLLPVGAVGYELRGFQYLTDPIQKAIVTKPFLKNGAGRIVTGIRTTTYRFNLHKHWIPIKGQGIKSGTKIPHINFGTEGRGHFLLGKYRHNGSRFFWGKH